VGDLVLDDRGVAVRGLLVRHLVLPNASPARLTSCASSPTKCRRTVLN